MIAIVVAGLMAAGSVRSGILEDTVWHAVSFAADEAPERDSVTPLGLCIAYWAGFAAILLVALYLAFVDIRYIRLQYAIEKQQLFRQSLGDELAQKVLDKNGKK